MADLTITASKTVWVAYTNTDCTECRGYQVPLAVCESEATAHRLGKGNYVMGSNCPVEPVTAVRLAKGPWLVPGRIEVATEDDQRADVAIQKKRGIVERAKALGLTDEEIKLLRSTHEPI